MLQLPALNDLRVQEEVMGRNRNQRRQQGSTPSFRDRKAYGNQQSRANVAEDIKSAVPGFGSLTVNVL